MIVMVFAAGEQLIPSGAMSSPMTTARQRSPYANTGRSPMMVPRLKQRIVSYGDLQFLL
jgi:hypothetical protein